MLPGKAFSSRHKPAAKPLTTIPDLKVGYVQPVPFEVALDTTNKLSPVLKSIEADILPILQRDVLVIVGDQLTNEGFSVGALFSIIGNKIHRSMLPRPS
jgi:hypothetical protein